MKPRRNRVLLALREIVPVLSEKYGVTRIGIFGSTARDDASEQSDVDIVYEMSRPNLFTVVHLKEELEHVLDCPVDLVRYRDRMDPLLKKRIDRDCVYV